MTNFPVGQRRQLRQRCSAEAAVMTRNRPHWRCSRLVMLLIPHSQSTRQNHIPKCWFTLKVRLRTAVDSEIKLCGGFLSTRPSSVTFTAKTLPPTSRGLKQTRNRQAQQPCQISSPSTSQLPITASVWCSHTAPLPRPTPHTSGRRTCGPRNCKQFRGTSDHHSCTRRQRKSAYFSPTSSLGT